MGTAVPGGTLRCTEFAVRSQTQKVEEKGNPPGWVPCAMTTPPTTVLGPGSAWAVPIAPAFLRRCFLPAASANPVRTAMDGGDPVAQTQRLTADNLTCAPSPPLSSPLTK